MRPDPSKIDNKPVNNLLSLPVNAVAKKLEESFSTTWQRMHTRTISAPDNYYSSRALAVGLTSAIEEARAQQKIESNIGIAAGIMEKYDFPMYYVSAPLVEALKHSHPPAGLTWKDIELPFPGLCFMVPRGSLTEPAETDYAEIMLLGIVKLKKGEQHIIPGVGKTEPVRDDRICVFWILAPSGLISNDTTFPAQHPLEPLKDWIDNATAKKSDGWETGVVSRYYGPATDFCVAMAGLVANFILVMQARKELVEPGQQLHWSLKKPIGTYSPTYIGRNYSVLRKQEGDGAESRGHFTELGWRAGHFKRQHWSRKNEQLKTIFVDPHCIFPGIEAYRKGA